MAEQICPNCKVDTFSWREDEDYTLSTIWGCRNCGYRAQEDESLERICNTCGIKRESRLEDETKIYWWCNKCNMVKLISEK